MDIQFISLGSGSSGNCYYLGTPTYGILIDAGLSTRAIRKHLKSVDINMDTIRAILVTHDHADHIKGVGYLADKLHLPIYTTAAIHSGINNNKCMREPLSPLSVHHIEKNVPFYIEDFHITAFEVPHDGTDNVGYNIEVANKVFTFATDLGEITPTAAAFLKRANYMIIEANYEEEMLLMGRYPKFLKERVAGPYGHLSNQDTADFLANEYQNSWKHIWLCHLSKDNNHPDLALKTMEYSLRMNNIIVGQDIYLEALKRTTPSELYTL